MNMIDIACFEVNEHGRLLSGNRRFCRMFGFEPSELPWHYVTDLYRHVDDWEKFRRDTENASFTTRMKNRRGRSFDCCIVREIFQNADGEVIFRNTIHKIGEGKGYVPQTVPLSVVFLAKYILYCTIACSKSRKKLFVYYRSYSVIIKFKGICACIITTKPQLKDIT